MARSKRVPWDLGAVGLCTLIADVLILSPVFQVPELEVLFGLLLALVLPGYAGFLAAFPVDKREDAETDVSSRYIEHIIFSVSISLVTTALIALAINFTSFEIGRTSILFGLNAITFSALTVAALRRRNIPRDQRYRGLVAGIVDHLSQIERPGGNHARFVNVVLLLSMLLAAGSVAYAISGPDRGTTYTEFYLLTENESGDLVAGGYPTEFERGQNRSLYLGIDNRERSDINYTVIIKLQRIRIDGDSTTVLEEERIQQFHVPVDRQGSETREHEVEATMTGEELRITYLLYKGDAPADPSTENAYRNLTLSITVPEPEG